MNTGWYSLSVMLYVGLSLVGQVGSAKRIQSLMLFVLVFAIFALPEDVYFLVIRVRRCWRKHK
jgi:hypothetical protein